MFICMKIITALIQQEVPIKETLDSCFYFKLKSENLFIYGENSKNSRFNSKLLKTSLCLKPYTSLDICLINNDLRDSLFNSSLKILIHRYPNNNTCYIPSLEMINTLKLIINFSLLKHNNNNIINTSLYLASLLANIFHGTDFLSQLGPNGTDLKYSRGIIQITSKESYQLITNISKTVDYVNYPMKLSLYTEKATNDSLLTYEKLLNDYSKKNNIEELSFFNTMQALKFNCKEPSDDLTNRINIYKRLCKEFGISSCTDGEQLVIE